MGVVQKQAFYNSFYSYIGVALGYINLIVLFPLYFSSEQFGLVQLLVGVSSVYSQFGVVGLYNIINRYFPILKTNDKYHNGLLLYTLLIGTSGFIIVTTLYVFLRPVIIGFYIKNSYLFLQYYFEVIPLSLFTMVFFTFEILVRVTLKSIFATFVREVAYRLIITVGILLYIFKIIDFNYFITLFVSSYGICSFMVLIQIVSLKEFKLILPLKQFSPKRFFELLKYGFYSLLSGAAMLVGQKVDVLMIGSFVGLSVVGAYSLYYYIAAVIYIPMRSMSKITVPMIADSWKNNNKEKISDIYRKSSLINLIFGCLIYIGVIINKDNLFYLIKKPEYIENFMMFPLIGLAILIDVSVGINSEIIGSSKRFRYDALFNIVLLTVSIISNYFLIYWFGGIGAAFAAVLSFFIFNFLKWLFIFIRFKMQPLDHKQLLVLLVALISFTVGYCIPKISIIFIDLFVRSMITTLIYGSGIIGLKISGDINERFYHYIGFIIKKTGR
ncbi:MAG: oligosaccharide flippase family protein [Ignavibacteriae bacterium]|nr:oligosaccharide flippase family protein [Ignavibacteriota bacterium]